uniref:Uncharacterized protein n=1 Tax=Spongospora subterranea TaxID=70186 RepID=A0A0H5QNS5_9EUKA|eukprot:CRZ03041.1 hypothetical protein [Spongospora subterranea]
MRFWTIIGVDRQSAFGKPIIVTVSECWDDDEDCNVGLIGQNTCVAYIGTDGRTGLTFCNTDHDIDAQPWRRYLPLTDQASVISAMDSGHNAPNHALPSGQQQQITTRWLTITCSTLFRGEYRRQSQTTAGKVVIVEYSRMYLDDVALSLGIPMDDPELFFYLLPNTFKFYASRAAK